MLIKEKIAIVTGAARGIGRGIAEVLSSEGAKVILCDINEQEAKKSAEEIRNKTGIETKAVKFDVINMHDIRKLVNLTVNDYGRIDILVNNAGIIILQSVEEVDEKSWDKIYDVNVKGPFFLSQAVAKVMMKQKSGKIINIASDSGLHAWSNESAYASSKAALISLTRVLALELGPHNINCNAVCPGATDTPMLRGFGEEKIKKCIEDTCLKRIATPVDIGNVVLFLASYLSDHITGEHIVVTAGEVMSQ
jgi:NAD(P)-dependent dehydrogenase (short-subunit alcohol dehydrogenase family)